MDTDEVVVSARIEFYSKQPDMPDRLWFKFPLHQKHFISDRADGFLTSMLLIAMQYGEDIKVQGAISPKLLSGINEYQRIFNMWFPKLFSLVDISCESLLPAEKIKGNGGVVCAFSGGVDSFFSLWSHLPENERIQYSQITDTVFALGFDIRLEDDADYTLISNTYAEMFERLGINFITTRTNFQHYGTRPEWGVFHGTAITGMAHVMSRKTITFYIPSSHTYNDLIPWGTDPRIDHLLSSESMDVVHDGASFSRTEKTYILSSWPETYDKLRVCFAKVGMNNCSHCEKCLRTMLTLDMFGMLDKYRTFPRPIDSAHIRKCRYQNPSDYAFAKELTELAIKYKRWDILFNIYYAIMMSRISQIIRLIKIRIGLIQRTLIK
jgi:hypothetical protein